jgi:tetratricopeptide (TPR) repeat protein
MTDKDIPHEENNVPAQAAAENIPARHIPLPEGFVKGQAERFHGRYVDLYKESLGQEGEIAHARWGLPLFHSLSDEDAEAQRLALGFEPRDALDFYNRGCLLAGRGDFAGAARDFERAVQLDASLADAYYNRALALEEAGDKAGARTAWQAYLARFNESEDTGEVRQHLESLQREA